MVVGPAIGWIAARITRRTDSQKQLLDTLERQADDIAELYENMGYVLRALNKRNVCRYIAVCPVDAELRKVKRGQANRKPRNRQYNGPDDYESTGVECTPDTGRPPPELI